MALTLDGSGRPFPSATVRLEASGMAGSASLGTALDDLVASRPAALDVDVSAVAALDVATVELLASVHTRLCTSGGRLRIVGANDQVADILTRRGLRGLLHAR